LFLFALCLNFLRGTLTITTEKYKSKALEIQKSIKHALRL
jgi:hypothetical protein